MSSVNENISQNKIDIVTNVENNVTVNQPTTSVVTVTTQGPQGAVGPAGPQGEPGAAADLTAINAFTGSAQINLNALNDFTSSVILASQTASMTVATASFAISASHEIIKEVSSSYADTASISNLAINANNVYVDANVNSSTGFHLPMYQPTAGGSGYADGYYQLKNPLNEVFYYSRGTNPITNLSNASDYLYIGGGSNTAGGIYFNSTVGTEPFLYSDFNRMYIKADDRFGANNASYPARLEISTYTGSFAATGVPNYISLESTEVRVTGSFISNGLTYPSTDGSNGQTLITDGAGNLSFGLPEKLHLQVRNDDSVDITAGTPIYSTGEIGGSERIKVRIAKASDSSKMPAIGIVETTLTTTGDTKDGFAIINGIYNTNITPVTGTPALGDNIYIHANGGVTTIKPSGSNLIQNIGTVLKTNGTIIQGMKVSSIDRTNDVPNLLKSHIFFGSGSDQQYQLHISGALDQTLINHISASGNISASGYVKALTGSFGRLEGLSPITVGDSITFVQPVTGSVFSGSFIGDGSNLTGITSAAPGTLSGSAQIATEISGAFTEASGGFSTRVTTLESAGASGIFTDSDGFKETINNLIVSQSNTTASLSVIGSGSAIFNVEGSAGQLFEVQDGLDGVLMSVNDISGIPILTVSSSGNVIIPAGSTFFGTASHALNVPGATSAFPFAGDARIDGTLDVTGSGDNIFKVRSKSGSLFSVDDGLDGILMSVNDISGLPLFEISSSGDVEIVVGNISGSGASTASFGTYIGDGSQLSGISAGATPTLLEVTDQGATTTNDIQITGSLTISGSFHAFTLDSDNIVLGAGAGASMAASANNNVILGTAAGDSLTTGDNNTLIGSGSGGSLTTTSQNTFIGASSGHQNTGQYNVAVGQSAARYGNGTTSQYNVAIGRSTLQGRNSSAQPSYTVAIGAFAGFSNNHGIQNTFIGYYAGRGNASSAANGDNNVGIGPNTLYNFGVAANNNIAIGQNTGYNVVEGANNILIGSGSYGTGDISNQLKIGNQLSPIISGSLETGDIHFKSTEAESLSIFRQEGSAAPGTGATQSIAVTVVSTGDGNKYALDGVITGSIVMNQGDAYKFDQSDSSNSTHPFRFSTDTAGSSNYDVGVVIEGTPGSAGAYTQISVTSGTTAPLYYYCSNHADMGLGGILSIDSGSLVSTGVVNITGSLIVSSSNVDFLQATGVSGSFSGSFQGDGSQLTGISTTPFPFTGDAQITGSLIVSGAAEFRGVEDFDTNVVIGKNATSTGQYSVVIGKDAGISAGGNENVVIGHSANLANNALYNVVIGEGAYGSGAGSVAIGEEATAAGEGIAIGRGANVSDYRGIAIGKGITSGLDQLSIGNSANGILISASLSTGHVILSGSEGGLEIIGSGSTLFEVIGSEGTIFALDDDLDGTLFTVNDRSGIPQFEVSASGLVEIDNGPLKVNTYETGSIANGSPSSPLQMTMPSGSSKQLYGVGGYYRASWDDGAADFVWFQDDYIKLSYDQSGVDIEGTIIKDAAGSNEIHISLDKDGTRSALDKQVSDGIFDLNATIGTDQTDRYIFAAPLDPTWPYYKIEVTRTSATHGSGFYAIVEKFI